jgi:hypothetical protein
MEAGKAEFERIMLKDCRMNPALAYPAFRMRIWVELDLANGTNEGIPIEFEAHAHGGPQQMLKEVPRREGYGELQERPPNQVRREAGLPIPTLVEDSQGKREVRAVKYARRTEHEGTEHEHEKHEHEKKEPKPGQQPQPQPTPHTTPETPKR